MDENGTLRTAVMLSGPRSYAIDAVRHWLALLVGFSAVFIASSGGQILTDTSLESAVGLLRILGVLAVATLLGHVLVTWIRKVVSLAVSGFFTWVSLVVVMTAMMIGADAQSFVANFWYSVFISVPVVLAATVLRVFVPWFQVHLNGRAVRPRLDSSQR